MAGWQTMDIFIEELNAGLPDKRQMIRLSLRLLSAALLGAVIGIQRERNGKSAGIRTHMLVSMGAALIVLGPLEFGMNSDDLSRVIQGLVTGIGFIGGGAILKLHDEREIEGLTTAAGIWMTAGIGAAAGLGRLGLAITGMIITWLILSLVGIIEIRRSGMEEKKAKVVSLPD
jgi:putative Mg2+ transporter-C (MgtC) family protein